MGFAWLSITMHKYTLIESKAWIASYIIDDITNKLQFSNANLDLKQGLRVDIMGRLGEENGSFSVTCWAETEVSVKSLHDSVTMVTGDLFMLRGFCFLTGIMVKLMLEQVILSNPAMMRRGSELIKAGSFVIWSRDRHRRQDCKLL